MGSYIYDQHLKSPLAELIKSPAFMEPIQEVIYYPVKSVCDTLGRPEDQAIYALGAIA